MISFYVLNKIFIQSVTIPVHQGLALTCFNLGTQFVILATLIMTRKAPPE